MINSAPGKVDALVRNTVLWFFFRGIRDNLAS